MKSVRSVIEDIMESDQEVLFCFEQGLLNLSAYAKKIQPVICGRLHQDVPANTIVAALSRLQKQMPVRRLPNLESMKVSDISVKTGLCEVTYEKTETIHSLLLKVASQAKVARRDFFALTVGLSQISFIIPENELQRIKKELHSAKPFLTLSNLAAVTVQFDSQYLKLPGVIFQFVKVLASRGVNIVEIVSTYTELSVIVAEEHLEATFLAWHRFSASKAGSRR